MTTILTYVSSAGLNPFTGDTYPDAYPIERTVAEIYGLLKSGFTVQDRSNGGCITLVTGVFYEQFKSELEVKPSETKKVEPATREPKGGK